MRKRYATNVRGVRIYPRGIGPYLHSHLQCVHQTCVIHNPSTHHMSRWPINIRTDRYKALAERICPHGVGHPDPDSLNYIESVSDPMRRNLEGIHGCDGCCATPDQHPEDPPEHPDDARMRQEDRE